MKSRTISRRGLNCALLGTLALASLPLPAQVQQEFPSKAVTIILSYPPGGLGDSSARRLAQRLSEMWKVPVLVDSKPGAAGLLGAGIVAKAPADGHTILYIIPETLSVTKALHRTAAGFDPINDLQPVAITALSSTVLVVPFDSPHKTFKDLIEFARRNPGKLNFGIQGIGSAYHLAFEQLKAMSGTEIMPVPYKGAGLAISDLLARRLDGMIFTTSIAIPYVQTDKLRVLAVASADRISQMPAVPTIAESGYPGYDAPVALATMVRAGTPRHIVDKLSADIRKVMHEPAMVEWLAQISTVTSNLTPEEFKARMQREIASYQRIIDKVGPQKFTE